MKKIEEKMVQAVKDGKNFSMSNTTVTVDGDVVRVYLFGNKIYEKSNGRTIYDDCGYPTVTTASRLRALGASIELKRGKYIRFL